MKMPAAASRPQKGDVGDRVERWRATIWMFILGMLITVTFLRDSPPLIAIAFPFMFAYAAGHVIAYAAGRSSHGFIHTLLAGRGEPRAPEYSGQEALLIRGQVADAIASFHNYIAHHPEDLDARIRLAQVFACEGNDPAAAEAMFLEARIVGTTLRQDVSVSNGLIDLYQAQHQREQLKAELARFARQHRGTLEGRNAHERLRLMVGEDGSADS